MKTVHIMIGIPGSGKSSIASRLFPNTPRLSADAIREELYGDAGNQGDPTQVWNLFFSRARTFVLAGISFVIDNTNANHKYRLELVDFIGKLDPEYNIVGVFVEVPAIIAKKRNDLRLRKVPHEVIDKMDLELKENPPGDGDGLDHVIVIKGMKQ